MSASKVNEAGGDVSEAVRNAASKLSTDFARTARHAQEAAEDLGDALRSSAAGVANKARQRAIAATHEVQEGIRAHPIAWLGAAAGAGALVGLLIARRTH